MNQGSHGAEQVVSGEPGARGRAQRPHEAAGRYHRQAPGGQHEEQPQHARQRIVSDQVARVCMESTYIYIYLSIYLSIYLFIYVSMCHLWRGVIGMCSDRFEF